MIGAAKFAALSHSGQTRKDGRTPYINHPVRVAMLLKRVGITDADVLQAALLHDTIEDTDVTAADLVRRFGEAVATLVLEVSDDKSLPKAERKRLQLLAPFSYGAALIKVSDKTVNLQDIVNAPPPWPRARKLAYFEHSRTLVARLCAEHDIPQALRDEFNQIYNTGLARL